MIRKKWRKCDSLVCISHYATDMNMHNIWEYFRKNIYSRIILHQLNWKTFGRLFKKWKLTMNFRKKNEEYNVERDNDTSVGSLFLNRTIKEVQWFNYQLWFLGNKWLATANFYFGKFAQYVGIFHIMGYFHW